MKRSASQQPSYSPEPYPGDTSATEECNISQNKSAQQILQISNMLWTVVIPNCGYSKPSFMKSSQMRDLCAIGEALFPLTVLIDKYVFVAKTDIQQNTVPAVFEEDDFPEILLQNNKNLIRKYSKWGFLNLLHVRLMIFFNGDMIEMLRDRDMVTWACDIYIDCCKSGALNTMIHWENILHPIWPKMTYYKKTYFIRACYMSPNEEVRNHVQISSEKYQKMLDEKPLLAMKCLESACYNNIKVSSFKYLYERHFDEKYKNFGYAIMMFMVTCCLGNLEMAKWMADDPEIRNTLDNGRLRKRDGKSRFSDFEYDCGRNNILANVKFHKLYRKKNVPDFYDQGKALEFLQKRKMISDSNIAEVFFMVCCNEQVEVADWLVDEFNMSRFDALGKGYATLVHTMNQDLKKMQAWLIRKFNLKPEDYMYKYDMEALLDETDVEQEDEDRIAYYEEKRFYEEMYGV